MCSYAVSSSRLVSRYSICSNVKVPVRLELDIFNLVRWIWNRVLPGCQNRGAQTRASTSRGMICSIQFSRVGDEDRWTKKLSIKVATYLDRQVMSFLSGQFAQQDSSGDQIFYALFCCVQYPVFQKTFQGGSGIQVRSGPPFGQLRTSSIERPGPTYATNYRWYDVSRC